MFGVGVTSVQGQDPIEVDSSNSASPIVKIKDAAPAAAEMLPTPVEVESKNRVISLGRSLIRLHEAREAFMATNAQADAKTFLSRYLSKRRNRNVPVTV